MNGHFNCMAFANTEAKTLRFDVVLSFDIDKEKALQILFDEIQNAYPGYKIQITPDIDISD